MRSGWKLALALGFVGAVTVATAAVGQVGSGSETRAPAERSERQQLRQERREHRDGFRRARRMVHGEFKVQTPDGFAHVVVDHGTVTAIDHGAKTLTIERADGESVTVTAAQDTVIRKDGEKAPFDKIEEGDRARIVQRDEGDGSTVKLIGAHTPREGSPGSTS